MKKIVYFSSIFCLLALTVIVSNDLFGQYDYVNDPDFPDIFEEEEHFDYPFVWTENSSSTNGYVHTPHGHIHMLVIFVGYTNTTSADDVGTPGTPTYWAHNDIPIYVFCKPRCLPESDAGGGVDVKFYRFCFFD